MIKVTIGNNTMRKNIIVDSNTTLRQALEANGVDYTHGAMMLDGVTLQPGAMDKTFAEFGIAESCYLLSVQKADNAAEIKTAGQAAVIISGVKKADIEMVKKYRPEALQLFGGEDNKEFVYAIGLGSGMGSINKVGAEFGAEAHDGSGKATITVAIPDDVDDVKAYLSDQYGRLVLNVNKIEATFPAVLEEVRNEKAEIEGAITLA